MADTLLQQANKKTKNNDKEKQEKVPQNVPSPIPIQQQDQVHDTMSIRLLAKPEEFSAQLLEISKKEVDLLMCTAPQSNTNKDDENNSSLLPMLNDVIHARAMIPLREMMIDMDEFHEKASNVISTGMYLFIF